MSARQADTHSSDALVRVREFLRADPDASPPMVKEDRAKVRDLRSDVRILARSRWFPGTPFLGRAFVWFERIFSVRAERTHRPRAFPALSDTAIERAQPRAFVGDYSVFDRLSIVYGGLFRGSVVVNYLLGIVGVGVTVCSILPQPRFVLSFGASRFSGFVHAAPFIEFGCIVLISVIFMYGQTPDHEAAAKRPRWRRLLTPRRFAHRWHERWLEYRLLAERFRYLELVLPLSPDAAQKPPFTPAEPKSRRWYDHYFIWRTQGAISTRVSVSEYREQALALMLEQVRHHDANSSRRGAIGRRLHKVAVLLFFLSLILCFSELMTESVTTHCAASSDRLLWGSKWPCDWTTGFNANLRSLVLFGAILAPVIAAAIHGVLATTEYTKVAESSRETADRIAALVTRVAPPGEADAELVTLEPLRDAVTAFADAAINEASGWHAMLRDKNVPLV
jgi:hypothetical protein